MNIGPGLTKADVEQIEYDKAVTVALAERERILREEIDAINALRYEEMDNTEKKAWKDYRKHLLDITKQAGYPFEIDWGIKPGGE
jgi:hypothetical protein